MTSPKIPQLDEPSIKILEDILKTTRSAGEGVDAVYYRAQHDDQLDQLDKLERKGFLRKHIDKYWVSLCGLTLINDAESKVLIENCEKIFSVLRKHYKEYPKDKMMVVDLAKASKLTFKEAAECLGYMVQVPWAGSHSSIFSNPAGAFIYPSEAILQYKNFQGIVEQDIRSHIERETQLSGPYDPSIFPFTSSQKVLERRACKVKTTDNKFVLSDAGDIWQNISNDYGISKRAFGKRINFVTDHFKREVLFRDIAQAYLLANAGFAKPAVILAGSVIEELLRIFLESKNITPTTDNFDGYVKACVEKGLLKPAVYQLTDSVRHFRNLIHLEKEISSRHTISKTTALGAVSSIFTIANDFDQRTK